MHVCCTCTRADTSSVQIASWKITQQGRATLAVGGPSHSNQPPFSWKNSRFSSNLARARGCLCAHLALSLVLCCSGGHMLSACVRCFCAQHIGQPMVWNFGWQEMRPAQIFRTQAEYKH